MLASKVCGLVSLGATGFCEYELFPLLVPILSCVSACIYTKQGVNPPNATAKTTIWWIDYRDSNVHLGVGIV